MGSAIAGVIWCLEVGDGGNCYESADKDVEGNVRSQGPSFDRRGGVQGGVIRPEQGVYDFTGLSEVLSSCK